MLWDIEKVPKTRKSLRRLRLLTFGRCIITHAYAFVAYFINITLFLIKKVLTSDDQQTFYSDENNRYSWRVNPCWITAVTWREKSWKCTWCSHLAPWWYLVCPWVHIYLLYNNIMNRARMLMTLSNILEYRREFFPSLKLKLIFIFIFFRF